MGKEAIWSVLFSVMKGIATRSFRFYKGPDFILRRRGSLGHRIAVLRYQEGAQEFDIVAEEGVDGGFSMDVNEMAASSIGYQNLSEADKIRIAKNIRNALVSQGFECQVIADNRLI
ncbi:hypothetical protein [Granulicella mallensis]|jgi:hypothetical protein|uniref:Uncharacterized protein n=1 Tax=Granulicella mallensis (strain ATCC BAA-1857 / DSM 23137 / MP5ACTX8) TaxID=682795 RepID=G8NRU9_GRAMM|nr:hypothetical protein [Granulicella mallensis]AEU35062.1 hypothetical protein AciX8_0713 [Granulicella mallensis MP5ACTX8]